FHESLAVAAERAIRIFSLTAFLVAISIAGTVWAQSDASISGSVTDPSGGAVSGATVTVRNLATRAERLLLSDDTGQLHHHVLIYHCGYVGRQCGNVWIQKHLRNHNGLGAGTKV